MVGKAIALSLRIVLPLPSSLNASVSPHCDGTSKVYRKAQRSLLDFGTTDQLKRELPLRTKLYALGDTRALCKEGGSESSTVTVRGAGSGSVGRLDSGA
jgi:hypothetical protein